MVGLGWYLDVFRSESHVLVWVLKIFGEKSQKEGKGESGQNGPLRRSEGHPCCGEVLRHSKGLPYHGEVEGQKKAPSGAPRRSLATPRRSHCSQWAKIFILF